jgi:hypothetical protein
MDFSTVSHDVEMAASMVGAADQHVAHAGNAHLAERDPVGAGHRCAAVHPTHRAYDEFCCAPLKCNPIDTPHTNATFACVQKE